MTPWSGKSSLKWNQWTQWGCSLGSSLPLRILVWLLHAPWVKCWPLPCNWGQKVFANNTTPGLESSHASLSVASPVLTSSTALWVHTPPPPAHHVWHQGFRHSSQVLIPSAYHEHQTQEAWSFLQQCIWWPMWQEGSCQNQERAHWQQWLRIQCQCQISSSGCYTWYHSHWRWQRVRASHQYQGCWVWQTWVLSQTQQCQQWVQSSTCPAWAWGHQSLWSSQGLCWLWQCCGCGGLWEYVRWRWRLHHGHEQGWWMIPIRICQHDYANIWDHQSECKEKHDKEHVEHDACEMHGKVQKLQNLKKELKSHK